MNLILYLCSMSTKPLSIRFDIELLKQIDFVRAGQGITRTALLHKYARAGIMSDLGLSNNAVNGATVSDDVATREIKLNRSAFEELIKKSQENKVQHVFQSSDVTGINIPNTLDIIRALRKKNRGEQYDKKMERYFDTIKMTNA